MRVLRKRRRDLGLSQEKVADRLGVTRQYYNSIERSKKIPSVELAKRIGAVLELDWTIFFQDEVNV